MSATGLAVFDRTLHTTNTWLDQILRDLGCDRKLAWRALGAVLHALRDRVPLGLAIHFGAQLPLLVRGLYYDQWHPSEEPSRFRSADEFLAYVQKGLTGIHPVNPEAAAQAVLRVINHYVDPNEAEKVRNSLPERIQALWPENNATMGRAHSVA
jgi:uncharacterized protein (DUF2267 family)